MNSISYKDTLEFFISSISEDDRKKIFDEIEKIKKNNIGIKQNEKGLEELKLKEKEVTSMLEEGKYGVMTFDKEKWRKTVVDGINQASVKREDLDKEKKKLEESLKSMCSALSESLIKEFNSKYEDYSGKRDRLSERIMNSRDLNKDAPTEFLSEDIKSASNMYNIVAKELKNMEENFPKLRNVSFLLKNISFESLVKNIDELKEVVSNVKNEEKVELSTDAVEEKAEEVKTGTEPTAEEEKTEKVKTETEPAVEEEKPGEVKAEVEPTNEEKKESAPTVTEETPKEVKTEEVKTGTEPAVEEEKPEVKLVESDIIKLADSYISWYDRHLKEFGGENQFDIAEEQKKELTEKIKKYRETKDEVLAKEIYESIYKISGDKLSFEAGTVLEKIRNSLFEEQFSVINLINGLKKDKTDVFEIAELDALKYGLLNTYEKLSRVKNSLTEDDVKVIKSVKDLDSIDSIRGYITNLEEIVKKNKNVQVVNNENKTPSKSVSSEEKKTSKESEGEKVVSIKKPSLKVSEKAGTIRAKLGFLRSSALSDFKKINELSPEEIVKQYNYNQIKKKMAKFDKYYGYDDTFSRDDIIALSQKVGDAYKSKR